MESVLVDVVVTLVFIGAVVTTSVGVSVYTVQKERGI